MPLTFNETCNKLIATFLLKCVMPLSPLHFASHYLYFLIFLSPLNIHFKATCRCSSVPKIPQVTKHLYRFVNTFTRCVENSGSD